MAEILKGAPVAAAMAERLRGEVEELRGRGIEPTLAILRAGERADDIAYEKSAAKRCDKIGIAIRSVVLPEDVSQEDLDRTLGELNTDPSVHGILMLRPLPGHLDGEKARRLLAPGKDVDGCTDGSLAGVFTNSGVGFPPCTAQAVMDILHYYDIDISGKRVAVIGRSLVIGRPVAMMLMHENATVAICHTRTVDVPSIAREADILVAAAGSLNYIGPEFTNPEQVVIDVGINWDEEKGSISGDADFDAVEPVVRAITPVPGGVGTVTSTVLAGHVVEAAKRMQ